MKRSDGIIICNILKSFIDHIYIYLLEYYNRPFYNSTWCLPEVPRPFLGRAAGSQTLPSRGAGVRQAKAMGAHGMIFDYLGSKLHQYYMLFNYYKPFFKQHFTAFSQHVSKNGISNTCSNVTGLQSGSPRPREPCDSGSYDGRRRRCG